MKQETKMERSEWMRQQRRKAEEDYDRLWSAEYDEKWGNYPNASHRAFIQKFLDRLPPGVQVLDAACGSGRYLPFLREKGHIVIGIDQSQGMLSKLKSIYPDALVEKIGLQEMAYDQAFDGAICMDAMEHVFPDDWPLILSNFHRAIRPGGNLYFTVEVASDAEVRAACEQARAAGLPVVDGEWPGNDGVYHYYPSMEQVKAWLLQAGFDLLEEGEGDGYHHFIVRRA